LELNVRECRRVGRKKRTVMGDLVWKEKLVMKQIEAGAQEKPTTKRQVGEDKQETDEDEGQEAKNFLRA